jgi:predicted DNA-binding WGR domain protein
MIVLERHDAARNMARYYCFTVERNLCGEWSLVRPWGRIGKPGRQTIAIDTTLDVAQAALHQKAQTKRRRGYQEHASDSPP